MNDMSHTPEAADLSLVTASYYAEHVARSLNVAFFMGRADQPNSSHIATADDHLRKLAEIRGFDLVKIGGAQ